MPTAVSPDGSNCRPSSGQVTSRGPPGAEGRRGTQMGQDEGNAPGVAYRRVNNDMNRMTLAGLVIMTAKHISPPYCTPSQRDIPRATVRNRHHAPLPPPPPDRGIPLPRPSHHRPPPPLSPPTSPASPLSSSPTTSPAPKNPTPPTSAPSSPPPPTPPSTSKKTSTPTRPSTPPPPPPSPTAPPPRAASPLAPASTPSPASVMWGCLEGRG